MKADVLDYYDDWRVVTNITNINGEDKYIDFSKYGDDRKVKDEELEEIVANTSQFIDKIEDLLSRQVRIYTKDTDNEEEKYRMEMLAYAFHEMNESIADIDRLLLKDEYGRLFM